jgi:hypothetical protein
VDWRARSVGFVCHTSQMLAGRRVQLGEAPATIASPSIARAWS